MLKFLVKCVYRVIEVDFIYLVLVMWMEMFFDDIEE